MSILMILISLLWIGAGAAIVAGVLTLFGAGWAMICAGAFLAATAAILRTGLNNG